LRPLRVSPQVGEWLKIVVSTKNVSFRSSRSCGRSADAPSLRGDCSAIRCQYVDQHLGLRHALDARSYISTSSSRSRSTESPLLKLKNGCEVGSSCYFVPKTTF